MVPCEVLSSRQRKLPTGFVRRTPRYFISFMNLTNLMISFSSLQKSLKKEYPQNNIYIFAGVLVLSCWKKRESGEIPGLSPQL